MPEKRVRFTCWGRGSNGEEALRIRGYKFGSGFLVSILLKESSGSEKISVGPEDCPCNFGSLGQRCSALLHPEKPHPDESSQFPLCAYRFDYPYVKILKSKWKPPEEIASAFAELLQEEEK